MKIIFIILTVSFNAPNIFCQNSTQSLGAIIERALAKSYSLEAAEQTVRAAQNVFHYARSQTLPQFSSELAREQRYLRPYNFRQQWALLHSDWSLGNFLLKSDRAAEQDVSMANAIKEQTRLDVTRRVASLYLNVLQKEVNTDLLQQQLQLLQTHYDVTQALWQAGARTELDVLQTESENYQLKEHLAMLTIERENLLLELEQLIDWSTESALQIAPLDAAMICEQPVPALSQEILHANPALRSLDFQISAQRFRVNSVRAQQLPHLRISGGYMEDVDPTGDGNYWQVDTGIELPLFRWGATKFQRQELQAALLAIESHKKEMERDLTIRVTQTLDKLRKLQDVLSLKNDLLGTEEKAFQLADANYRAGLATNLEYLSAQQKLVETRIDIQEIQLDYVMNLIDYYISTNQVEKITDIESEN